MAKADVIAGPVALDLDIGPGSGAIVGAGRTMERFRERAAKLGIERGFRNNGGSRCHVGRSDRLITLSYVPNARMGIAPAGVVARRARSTRLAMTASGGHPGRGPGPRRPLENPDGRALRILIVEDEALVALDLAAMVSDHGAQVVGVAAAAEEATRLAAVHRPDVVLMDVRLARGDGVAAARQIQAERATPVVFVTGNTESETRRRIAEVDGAIVVSKPILTTSLLAAIRQAARLGE